MYYIQETDKLSKILKMFNIVKLQGDRIILPIKKQEQITEKTSKKLAEKTDKILKKANSNKVILSKEIRKKEQYVNYLNTYNFNIVDGEWLFEVLTDKILEYIIETKELNPHETQITFLVNQLSEITLENIKKSLNKYKKISIVTNHIEKFKKIEEQYLDEYGIPICVTNNRKKSLAKSKIIINIDFSNELINTYQIYEEAIIVNIPQNIKIKKKRFNGYNINDYEIDIERKDEFDYDKGDKFRIKDIYEAKIYKNQPYKQIENKIKKDNIKIVKLIAINGEI